MPPPAAAATGDAGPAGAPAAGARRRRPGGRCPGGRCPGGRCPGGRRGGQRGSGCVAGPRTRGARQRRPGGQRRLAPSLRARLPQHAQQPLHLAQCLPADRLDRAQRGPCLTGLAVEDVLAVARLHGDHGHAVRDHVVQFPGDPQPLQGDRIAGRPLPDVRHVAAALLHRVADDPDDGQHQADRDRVAGAFPAEVHLRALHAQQGQGGGQPGPRDGPPGGAGHHVQHEGQREERAFGDLGSGHQDDYPHGEHEGQGPARRPPPERDRRGQAERQERGQQGRYRQQVQEAVPAVAAGEQRAEDERPSRTRPPASPSRPRRPAVGAAAWPAAAGVLRSPAHGIAADPAGASPRGPSLPGRPGRRAAAGPPGGGPEGRPPGR